MVWWLICLWLCLNWWQHSNRQQATGHPRGALFFWYLSVEFTMSYIAPVKDMLFNIEHLAHIEQIAQ